MSREWRYRSSRSFSRRKGQLKPRKRILLICEGTETEPAYFNALRQRLKISTLEVEICGGKGRNAPISLVDYAVEKKVKNAQDVRRGLSAVYDEIWCVFDVDGHESIDRAVVKAGDNGISLAISNPCFEYWILLHYENTNRGFLNCDEVIRHIKGNHIPDYAKGALDADVLQERIQTAIQRATLFEANYPGDKSVLNRNSSTDTFKPIANILELAQRPYN